MLTKNNQTPPATPPLARLFLEHPARVNAPKRYILQLVSPNLLLLEHPIHGPFIFLFSYRLPLVVLLFSFRDGYYKLG